MSILALILCSLLSLIIAWAIALYGNWRTQEQSRALKRSSNLDMLMRYLRRGRYSTERVLRSGLDIVSTTARKSFIFFFPKSKHAFKDIDPLTGLEKGPSSYFLLEISQKIRKVGPSRRTKKSVQE